MHLELQGGGPKAKLLVLAEDGSRLFVELTDYGHMPAERIQLTSAKLIEMAQEESLQAAQAKAFEIDADNPTIYKIRLGLGYAVVNLPRHQIERAVMQIEEAPL